VITLRALCLDLKPQSLTGVIVAHCYDTWVRTGRYSVWSLTPGFAFTIHFYEMIVSFRVDCCADTWLELSLNSFIIWKSVNYKTQLSGKRTVVNSILFSFTWFWFLIIKRSKFLIGKLEVLGLGVRNFSIWTA